MSAYNAGDAAALAAMYASDARVQYGYCAPVSGRDAIKSFWNDDLIAGGIRTRLMILDSFEIDELVYLSGEYIVNDPHMNGGDPIKGSFTQIWRRRSGSEWSVYRESWANVACIKVRFRSHPPPADEPPDGPSATAL